VGSVTTPGSRFGRYQIESVLGEGGMGQVLRAVDTVLERPVALKIIRPDREGRTEAIARFFREARLAAQVRHPNAVEIYDLGEVDGVPFIAMELIEGRSLKEHVGDPSVPLDQKLRWMLDVARGLAAAHKRGLIHRDVKPANVMVSVDATAKVVDFGLAKRTSPTLKMKATFQTMLGFIVGTPAYMAPEQLEAEDIDARADQFAWALTTYVLVSGVNPRTTDPMLLSPIQALDARVPDVGARIGAVVARALRRRPDDRFASMDDVIEAFAGALATFDASTEERPVERPRPRVFHCARCAALLGDDRTCPRCGSDRYTPVPHAVRAPSVAPAPPSSVPVPAVPVPVPPPVPVIVGAPIRIIASRAHDTVEPWTFDEEPRRLGRLSAALVPIHSADISADGARIVAFGPRGAAFFDREWHELTLPSWVVPRDVRCVKMLHDGTFAVAGLTSLAARLSITRPLHRWNPVPGAELFGIAALPDAELVFVGHRGGHGIELRTAGMASALRDRNGALVGADIGMGGRVIACGVGTIAILSNETEELNCPPLVRFHLVAGFDDGAFVAGDHGQLLVVRNGTEPARERTETAATITALTVGSDGQAWAGTDLGKLLRRETGRMWPEVARLDDSVVAVRASAGQVVAIGAHGVIVRGGHR
jgi:serine/threonine-protein kinase